MKPTPLQLVQDVNQCIYELEYNNHIDALAMTALKAGYCVSLNSFTEASLFPDRHSVENYPVIFRERIGKWFLLPC